MSEKNSDVEWLRALFIGQEYPWPVLHPDVAHRILAHIDQLEAEAGREVILSMDRRDGIRLAQLREAEDRRPTIHEIAPQMMAGMLMNPINNRSELHDLAEAAYKAAEALVAEGRGQDGQA